MQLARIGFQTLGPPQARTPPILGISEQSAVISCELRRNIREIGENIANQFDCVKTKSESNVQKETVSLPSWR
jgi:hypothetical protein